MFSEHNVVISPLEINPSNSFSSLDDVGHVVVDRTSEPDDPVHQEAGEDIDRSSIKLSLFDDGGIDMVAQDSAIAAEGSCTDVPDIAGKSFKSSYN